MQEKKQLKSNSNILKNTIQQSLEDSKAQEITQLSVTHLTSVTDTMFICSGASNRQMSFIADSVSQAVKEAGFEVLGTEGLNDSDWMIVDCGDAVVHIMSQTAREFYHLEGLWNISEHLN